GILYSSGYFLLYEDIKSITIKIFTLEIIYEIKVKNNYGKLELKGNIKDIDEIEEILRNKVCHINIKKEVI
ncbi:hypothetical protein, partial [Clostridium sp.]|uniref:hypothetical protein n=1 Tax=Clostridium sp. TaxID=1506 RepID=UPI003F2FA0CB